MPRDRELLSLTLDGHSLTVEDVATVARRYRPVEEIAPGSPAYAAIMESARWVEEIVEDNARRAAEGQPARAIYGINTGFGIHAAGQPFVDPEMTRQVSRKLIMSHAVGVGEPLDEEVVRAAMVIRANTLAKGRSGVRPVVINRLIQMLNRQITPVIPRSGSLGSSGDLAPLSHLALVISREPESMAGESSAPGFDGFSGEAAVPITNETGHIIGRKVVPAQEAMTWDGEDQRIVLRAKEGLALNNGATFSAALGVLALLDAENLVANAEIAVAMTLEALQGYRDAFLPQIHHARPHPGQIATASNVLRMVEDSLLVDPGHVDHDPVLQPPQDAYSLRCAPQVIGVVREVLARLRDVLTREINAATDNPLIFVRPEDGLPREYKAISGGNFHGEVIASELDHLKIALTELAGISERRTFWLLDANMSRGLPSMLVRSGPSRIESGLMLAQYVAASLVSKCKTLAHPDSIDSIPSSANQEDYVSMSMNAGLHTREIVENVTAVIAIELLTALTALRHRLTSLRRDGTYHPLTEVALGRGTQAVWAALQDAAPELFEIPLDRDVIYYPYLRRMIEVVQSGALVEAVREAGIPFYSVRSSTELVVPEG
ncbi:MAG TPA: aromatic amino acid lyase [Aggregatilineales bacterium]|nr:aromatic amino acid lyase [Chloroflexota bacterium]HOA22818.1 aromatic amino acid lyase [Aggregatilineales bacterium]HPV05907.1 aromatic amino acid lyase [Aggregatilineales bacterium]HQA68292.1 aromatic amino acid lyase [Aggregatilineales bacterium]HQE19113.1 aromatic amino acid lyase [Aggregatilineales bacterium]